MARSVVLVTGAGRLLGSRLVAALADAPGIARVIGVDTSALPVDPAEPAGSGDPTGPAGSGRVEFVRVDLRHPDLARLLTDARVDTVVHAATGDDPPGPDDDIPPRETAVLGTLRLLAACQSSGHLRRLVVRSSAAVYGSTGRDPALFTEQDTGWDHPLGWGTGRDAEPPPRGERARDALDVEGYVRSFGRHRPDVSVLVLRLANLVGRRVRTPLTRYLGLPVVPTVAGFDPRLQFLHTCDAVEVFRRAVLADGPWADDGPHRRSVNVAGSGVLTLSQAIRRAGRVALPLPGPAVPLLAGSIRRTGLADLRPDRPGLLALGGVLDTTRLRSEFGYQPRFTSAEAFDDFARDLRPGWWSSRA